MIIYCENEVPMSAKELWRSMHTQSFDALVAKEFSLLGYIELEKKVSNNIMKRRVRIISRIDYNFFTQKMAKKILGSDILTYEEVQTKDLSRFELYWEIIPPVYKDKFEASGILRLEPLSNNSCIRIREGSVKVNLPGANRLMKIFAAVQSKKNTDRFLNIVEKWKTSNHAVLNSESHIKTTQKNFEDILT